MSYLYVRPNKLYSKLCTPLLPSPDAPHLFSKRVGYISMGNYIENIFWVYFVQEKKPLGYITRAISANFLWGEVRSLPM